MNQAGAYGQQGVPSPASTPGARYQPDAWTDAAGNLWLFGGYGYANSGQDSFLNDLWKFDPSARAWEWVGGSNRTGQAGSYGIEGAPSSANHPGARYQGESWVGAQGDFWLYGGHGVDSNGQPGELADLWKYNPTTNQWAWEHGSSAVAPFDEPGAYGAQGTASPANHPGWRENATTWTSPNGDLWMFGGFGTDSTGTANNLNDLWEYDPTTNEWAWMSGSKIGGQPGSYGTENQPSPANAPGARFNAMGWTDAQGNLWLFGGDGNDADPSACGSPCELSDLWEYSISAGQWIWRGGPDKGNAPGTFTGFPADPSAQNVPPARENGVTWILTGTFWLFGGDGGPGNDYNDLWQYTPTMGWAFFGAPGPMRGPGAYGTKGQPSADLMPGARDGAVGWVDRAGNFWLFGGENVLSVPYGGKFNDMWEYGDPNGIPHPAIANSWQSVHVEPR